MSDVVGGTSPEGPSSEGGPQPSRRRPEPAGAGSRLVAAGFALAFLGVLGLAAWLTPAAEGQGTHTQLGLAPCPWVVALDTPCVTCGMTTSFAYAADGRLLEAIVTQPFGFLLALGTAVGFWVALHVAVTGSRIGTMACNLVSGRVVCFLLILAGLAWGYKVLAWKDLI